MVLPTVLTIPACGGCSCSWGGCLEQTGCKPAAKKANSVLRAVTFPARFAVLAGSLAALIGPIGPALGQQVIERPDLPQPERFPGRIQLADKDYGEADPTPLGVDLAGIRLIGQDENVEARAAPGITIGAVPNAPEAELLAALKPFLSEPLSLALVTEIQAAVARTWSRTGYPFVSVTVPPQEITTGVLQLRVIEARLGDVRAEGSLVGTGDRLVGAVRSPRGGRIDAAGVDEDVRWMNRHGNRRVEAVFAAGDGDAESDLVLKVTDEKRWSAFAGWSNTGSSATGVDRYFVGAVGWIPEWNDVTISYQLTGSSSLWSHLDRIVPRTGDFPSYLGHAGRIVIPTGARQSLEISPTFIASRENIDPLLAQETEILELPVSYRMALSEIVPGLYMGDIHAGVEFKRLHRNSLFAGTVVARGEADLFQITAGWSHVFFDRYGRTAIDLGVKINPGGVMAGNDAATWNAFTGGRISDMTYAYLTADMVRQTVLPGGLVLSHHLTGQLAGQPLPDPERFQLGGYQAARGYRIDDGSVDSGLVLRNELRLPPVSLVGALGVEDTLSSYLFLDVAHGRDLSLRHSTTLASLGAGIDHDVGGHLSIGLAAGVALADAALTRRGDVAVHARVVGAF